MGNLPCCTESEPSKHREPVPTNTNSTSQPAPIHPLPIIASTPPPAVLPTATPISNISPPHEKGRGPESYQYIKFLGKGSFGFVVEVEEKETGRRLAMKIIEKSKIKEFNVFQSQLIQRIGEHELLVPIRETFQNQAHIYIIMEMLPMGDLYFYLRKKEITFTEQIVKWILAEVICGLEHLHSCGVVYRQLKPQNMMLTRDGHLKLTDYGLSKLILNDKPFISTFIGTPDYMAPEVLSGPFDRRADIWSLGIVMFELLFKENPYDSGHKIQFLEKQYQSTIDSTFMQDLINSKIGYMSLPFRDLLLKLLEKDPQKRITLQEVKNHEFFMEIDWQQVAQQRNVPPLKQILEKHDIIKFRDPTGQEYLRKRVARKHQSQPDQEYQLRLFEFRTSQ